MNLGTFSVSLAVKDIHASIAFYEKLGFRTMDGAPEENWVILQNGSARIGLFQGMFERNIVTFNPPDVRSIQSTLLESGVELVERADPESSGPAHITMLDPDGNPVLLDQFDADHPQAPKTTPALGWTDLTTDRADELRDFYASVLGADARPISMGEYDDYSLAGDAETPVGGVCHRAGPNASLPEGWIVYFRVADVGSAVAQCQASGGSIVSRTDPATAGYAVLRDPAGNAFAVMA